MNKNEYKGVLKEWITHLFNPELPYRPLKHY